MDGLNSNLNLDGASSPRVRPRVSELGPREVPTTAQKRRQRWLTIAVLVLVLAALIGFGTFAWLQLRGY